MAVNRLTLRDRVYLCPACDAEVLGSYSVEASEISLVGGKGDAKLKLVGLKADDHNCIPPTTREAGKRS